MNDNYITTFTGRKICPLDPDPEQINIIDIAHHLSNLCRFAGAVIEFYSVAEHSCRVYDYLKWLGIDDPIILLWALLHDASEAYLMDLPAPVKHSEEMETYRQIEKRMMDAICIKFNIPLTEPEEIYFVDKTLLVTEQRDLMYPGSFVQNGIKPLQDRIHPWPPVVAKYAMIERLKNMGLEVTK